MRAFCILAMCIGTALSGTIERERRQASNCVDQKLTNVCVQDATGPIHFPHPTANNKFLQCAPGHRMFVITCPDGEVYHHATTSCDSPQAATTQRPVVDPSQMNPCTPENLAANNLFFPYPRDHTKFIECSPQGQPTVLTCPPRLAYDADRQSCVFPTGSGSVPVVGTGSTGTGSTGTGTTGTGTGGSSGGSIIGSLGTGGGLTSNPCPKSSTVDVFFPHPADKSMYIECDRGGNAFIMTCPANLIWNSNMNYCDSRYAAFQATGSPVVG